MTMDFKIIRKYLFVNFLFFFGNCFNNLNCFFLVSCNNKVFSIHEWKILVSSSLVDYVFLRIT